MEELTLRQAVEEFNFIMTDEIEREHILEGTENGPDGFVIYVTTPWACGVEGEEVEEGTIAI